jgi:hypothetical protein
MSDRKITITMSAFLEATDNDLGFCTECGEFTTSCCEPDARRYACEQCEEPSVYGTEEALFMGLITIDDPGATEE